MRIPTSVIVMSLVTAAPFALAVRDTLHPQPKHHSYDDEIDASQEAETARYEREMQRMEEEQQAAEARKQTVLKDLLGEPGKLGSYVDSITLGASRDQVDAITARIESASEELVYLVPSYDATDKLSSLRVVFNDCDKLREAVHAQWGEGNRWVDAATHVKTTFDEDESCSLYLDRYVDMEQFLAKTTTASIPLGAIGKPSSTLPGDLGAVSVGLANTGVPNVTVDTDDSGRIVTLSVTFEADVEADAPIRARLDTLLGKGTQDVDTGEWQWKGKIPVHYNYTDAHVYMVVGQL